jgi:tetratricopeptide (TPR) repeat protein
VGWLWYLGTLVPVIGLIQVGAQAMADRYTYIPLIGLFIMVAWGIPEVMNGRRFKRTAMVVAAGAIVFILMIKTSIQVGYWQNSAVLFEHALDVTADNYLAHSNLGAVLEKQGRMNEAFRHYSEALRLHPDLSAAHNNMGNILLARDKSDEAIHHYSEAFRLKPSFALAHSNLGIALFRKGRLEEARVHFRKALQIRPGYHDAHKNLKITSDVLRKIDTAVSNLKQALVIIPQDPLLPEKIERLNKGKRELDKVIDRFMKALSLQTGFDTKSFDINNLTRVHLIKQEYDQTFSLFEEVIKVQPNSAGAYYHIACIYARQNNTKESLDWLNQAIQRGFVNWELLRTDRDLENIRYTSFYKQLVERH